MRVLDGPLHAVRAFVRRRRRIVAACCAALAVLLLAGSRGTSAPDTPSNPRPHSGRSAVPLQLTAAGLQSGDRIDLVLVGDTAPARIVARDARVLQVSGSGFTSSSAASVFVEVDDADALTVVAASGQLVPIVRGT